MDAAWPRRIGWVGRVVALGALVAGVLAGAAAIARQPAPAAPTAGRDAARPLVFVFQRQKDPAATRRDADAAAEFLSLAIGRPVQAVVPTDYGASVQALVSKRADFAYVSAVPFLLARRDGGATLLLAEERPDAAGVMRTRYDAAMVVRADSSMQGLSDLVRTARDVRVAFTSTTSTSGYIMPYLKLVEEGVLKPGQDPREAFRSAVFAGGYTAALEQVLDRRADVACVSAYTIEGPTADVYTTKEQRSRLRVLARQGDVPTHLVAAGGHVDEPTRQAMRAGLLRLAKERPDLLRSVYGAVSLVEATESEHVKPVVEALGVLGKPLDEVTR